MTSSKEEALPFLQLRHSLDALQVAKLHAEPNTVFGWAEAAGNAEISKSPTEKGQK